MSRSCCEDWSWCQYRYHILFRFRANKPYSGSLWQKEVERLIDRWVYSKTKTWKRRSIGHPSSIKEGVVVSCDRSIKLRACLVASTMAPLSFERLNPEAWWISIIIEQGYKEPSKLCDRSEKDGGDKGSFHFTQKELYGITETGGWTRKPLSWKHVNTLDAAVLSIAPGGQCTIPSFATFRYLRMHVRRLDFPSLTRAVLKLLMRTPSRFHRDTGQINPQNLELLAG